MPAQAPAPYLYNAMAVRETLTQRHHHSLTVAGHDGHDDQRMSGQDALASRSQLHGTFGRTAHGPPPAVYAAGYLATGTALALMGQVVTNQGAADPSAQLVAWTRYLCTFTLSLLVQAVARPKRTDYLTRKAKRLVVAVG